MHNYLMNGIKTKKEPNAELPIPNSFEGQPKYGTTRAGISGRKTGTEPELAFKNSAFG